MIRKIKGSFYQVYISLAIVLIFVCATWFHLPFVSYLIERVDYVLYDNVISKYWHKTPAKVKVVIIDIDTKSMNEQGKWPWPRDKIARLITNLKNKGVVVVALDIVMTEADVNFAKGLKEKLSQLPDIVKQKNLKQTLTKLTPLVDNDTLLAKSMSNQDVVLGYLLHYEKAASKGALPKPLLLGNEVTQIPLHKFDGHSGSLPLLMQAAHGSGFVSNIPDHDGNIRKSILIARYDGKTYASIALQAVMTYLLTDTLSLTIDKGQLLGINLDKSFIPTTNKGEIFIPFYGEPGTLTYYSATDILNNRVPRSALEGSIAVVGSSMILISDLHPTPISPLFPGAELIGNMITGIISKHITYPLSNNSLTATLLISVIGSVYAIVFPLLSLSVMLLVFLLSIAIIVAIFIMALVYFQAYLPIAVILLIIVSQTIANAIYAYLLEKQQKRKISHLFGQYVPESYVLELIKSEESLSMEGEERYMTALFTDIRNFTTLSQSLHANEVKRTLNTFFTPITKIIFDNKGTIDKYVGDLVMAFWGAPIKDPEHAQHAIDAALTIIKQLPIINQNMRDNALPEIQIGIGMASGVMNVGDMGSEFRRSYTVIGDTVNLASRLESLTKFYQVDILVNGPLVEQVTDVIWLPIDKVIVKGRDIAETIYQPLGWSEQVTSEIMEMKQQYIDALNYYYAQDWHMAKLAFEKLAQQMPETYLFQLYQQRIVTFMKSPPPEDWQGVFIHVTK